MALSKMLGVVRKMSGGQDYIYTIDLNHKDNPDPNDMLIALRKAIMSEGDKWLKTAYMHYTMSDGYMLEDVIHKIALLDFGVIATVSSITIKYNDCTYKMRVILEGEDEVPSVEFFHSENLKCKYDGDVIDVRLRKYNEEDGSEVWEYYVYSNDSHEYRL